MRAFLLVRRRTDNTFKNSQMKYCESLPARVFLRAVRNALQHICNFDRNGPIGSRHRMTEKTETQHTSPARDALDLAAALRAVVDVFFYAENPSEDDRAKASFDAGFALGQHSKNRKLNPAPYIAAEAEEGA